VLAGTEPKPDELNNEDKRADGHHSQELRHKVADRVNTRNLLLIFGMRKREVGHPYSKRVLRSRLISSPQQIANLCWLGEN
jgi:hypothetical protein